MRNGVRTLTIQYNWIKDAYYQHMQLGACGSATQTDHVINTIVSEMAGYGSSFLVRTATSSRRCPRMLEIRCCTH